MKSPCSKAKKPMLMRFLFKRKNSFKQFLNMLPAKAKRTENFRPFCFLFV